MRFNRLPYILASLSILAACQSTAPKTATPSAASPAQSAPFAQNSTATGVAVCDDYLNKYEACLRDKLPEASRAQFQSSLDAVRKYWIELAANPQSAAELKNACVQAKSSAAVALQGFGCSFE